MQNKNPLILIITGIILLFIGGGLYFKSSAPSVSSEDQARCEQQVQQQYGENSASVIGSCKTDTGFVAMMNAQNSGATSAEEIAKAVSSANQKEVGLGTLGKFLMGLCLGIGIVIIIKGFIALKNKGQPAA